MKKILFVLVALMLGIGMRAGDPANYEVVPRPQSIVEKAGNAFILEEGVQILAPESVKRDYVQTLRDVLGQYGTE